MFKKMSVSIFILTFLTPLLLPGQAERWVYQHDGSGSGSDDQAFDLVMGSDGNLYACGHGYGTSGNTDFTVISLTPAGGQRWVYQYNGTANANDQARKVVYGGDGNIYAAGYASNSATGSQDLTVISLTPAGGQRWVYTWDASHDGGADDGYDLVYGADGNIYVAGTSQSIDWPGWGRDPWVTVLSLDTSGDQRWVYSFDTLPPNSQWGSLNAIAWGADGNVYCAGRVDQGTYLQYNYFAVVSLTASGGLRWTYLNSADNSSCQAILYGPDGYLYCGGYLWHAGGGQENFAVVRVTTGGGESWVYEHESGYSDICYGLICGPDSNLYACGSFGLGNSSNDRDLAVVSLNRAGGERWLDAYNGPGSSYDVAYALCYGRDTVYSCGITTDTFPLGYSFSVVGHTNAGALTGVYRYQTYSGYGRDVVFGADGYIYAAGTTMGNYYDFTVISPYGNIGLQEKTAPGSNPDPAIRIGPALVRSELSMSIGRTDQGPVLVEIFNSAGRRMLSELREPASGRIVLAGPMIGRLASGAYFVRVSAGGPEVRVGKFVKID